MATCRRVVPVASDESHALTRCPSWPLTICGCITKKAMYGNLRLRTWFDWLSLFVVRQFGSLFVVLDFSFVLVLLPDRLLLAVVLCHLPLLCANAIESSSRGFLVIQRLHSHFILVTPCCGTFGAGIYSRGANNFLHQFRTSRTSSLYITRSIAVYNVQEF